jgi:aminopeptidase-like protein
MRPELTRRLRELDADAVGREIYGFAEEAYPICRSLTGDGVRETLRLLQRRIPLEIREVPTGTAVFDWTVPREWNVRDAWVKDARGERVIDFRRHNLHLLGYSVPVHRTMPLAELREHLYSLPDKPDLIPYRTSYYQERWGFCLPHRRLEALEEGDYEVSIDATLEPGHLTWGELFLEGETDETVLFSAHVCHPSLANDNLSGLGVCCFLARTLQGLDLRYSYRFLFAPGTIGAIAWLALNEDAARKVRHGLVAANLGDPGRFHYKKSRRGDAEIDRAVVKVLADSGEAYEVEDFVPFGYDERQYCSPGFDLPVGSLTRTPWGRYPEYHTSADDLDLVSPEQLGGSLRRYLEVVHLLEVNGTYENLSPHCEPQLGRRGLYRTIGGDEAGRERELALLWVLNLSDGKHSLLDVAERSGMGFGEVADAARALLDAGLLAPSRRSPREDRR